MMKKHMTPKNLALLACLTIALAGSGCTDKETSHFEGVHSFIVTAIPDSGQYGTVDSPLATTNMFVGKDAFGVTLAAYAVDIEGNLVSDFNGTVELSSEPGELASPCAMLLAPRASGSKIPSARNVQTSSVRTAPSSAKPPASTTRPPKTGFIASLPWPPV